MKKLIFLSIFFLFSLASCSNYKDEQILENAGTLTGFIGLYQGNCMPSPGIPPCSPSPLSAMVIITQPSAEFDQNLVVDSVLSNSNGQYSIYLPVGKYSLFLRDGKNIVCDSWYSDGQNTHCMPFEIKKDSVTILDANIDHAAW